MWSVGISVSPCEDAARIGYDARQINRLVIRMSQFFLDQDMRLVFGHDWREDGVMRAVAGFAEAVAASRRGGSSDEGGADWIGQVNLGSPDLRMVNVVPTGGRPIGRVALRAMRESRGVLGVVGVEAAARHLSEWDGLGAGRYKELLERVMRNREIDDAGRQEIACLRVCVTWLLREGCRICLAGQTEPRRRPWGVAEEAGMSMDLMLPLYVMGGYGGAARRFAGERQEYWESGNGLEPNEKRELYDTTDIERALKLIGKGIAKWREEHAAGG